MKKLTETEWGAVVGNLIGGGLLLAGLLLTGALVVLGLGAFMRAVKWMVGA